jgi:CBS-domain-containing membrane protein
VLAGIFHGRYSVLQEVAVKNRAGVFWATIGEGGLMLAVAATGLATNQPLIFASLGPTAYELVEQPQLPSARPYNIIIGHLIGLGAGFLAVYLLNAWAAPNVLATGVVSAERMWASPYRRRSLPSYRWF